MFGRENTFKVFILLKVTYRFIALRTLLVLNRCGKPVANIGEDRLKE